MTPTYSESQPPPPRLDPAGPIHLIVPLRPGADLEQLRARLTSVPALQQRSVQWHVPGARADIVHLAARAVDRASQDGGLVVAAGGDGTINAVAAAAWARGVPMGVVPLGTFNYFAREQALSLDPAQAVQDILQALQAGQMRPVNVGLVNERLFLVNASLGLYPRLLDERERASTRFGRTRLVAIAASIWSILRGGSARRWRIALRSDRQAPLQQQEHLASTLFVGNNPMQLERVGITEARAVADGQHLAAVLLLPQASEAPARVVWNAVLGRLAQDDAVASLACTELVAEPAGRRPRRLKVAFDGEREWMAPPIRFRLGEKPLWLVVPGEAGPSS